MEEIQEIYQKCMYAIKLHYTDIYTKQTFSRVSANETEPGTWILIHLQPDESDNQIVLYAQRDSGPNNLKSDNAPTILTLSKCSTIANYYPLISQEISKHNYFIVVSCVRFTDLFWINIGTSVSTEFEQIIIIINCFLFYTEFQSWCYCNRCA